MKKQEFKIESGVPMPNTKGRKLKYPFDKMKVGDSFELPKGSPKTTVLNAANSWLRRNNPQGKFSIRFHNDKLRIWRVK